MSFDLQFTPEAEETYDSLILQLQQRWGANFVHKLETKVLKCLQIIVESPYIYPLLYENTGVRRCVLHKNCSMLYKVDKRVIVIVCFWDNRQETLFT